MANLAYIRVSSIGQEYDRQEHILAEEGINIDKTFKEKTSGKNTKRPELKKMLSYVREGDVVFIESISRLARNTKDFLTIQSILEEKKVGLVSLKEDINTTTPVGRFLVSIFASLAQLERETIHERQAEAFAARRAAGLEVGRPTVKMPKEFAAGYKKWRDGRITATDLMKELGLKRTTFYKLVKEYESTK